MSFTQWIYTYRTIIVSFVLISVLCIVIGGVYLFPELFYDQWIWKYYWGPVVADATPSASTAIHNGVVANEGYTLVSEITYGILLIIALFYVYKLLKKLHITINWRFCLALFPYIVYGPVTRVLEDASYFHEPFVYWFISPLIYLQIAGFALFFIVLGSLLERKMSLPHLTINRTVFFGGVMLLLPFLYDISRWLLGDQWSASSGVRFDVFLLVVGLVSGICFFVYLFAYLFKNNEDIAVYKHPLNLAMIGGHLIDGLTSYISIYDPLQMGLPSYLEKHPASNTLMEVWPPLFPIVKFLLIILVIYIFDILYKKEFQHHYRLVNLLKIGIFILGVSPGLRDLLRVTMGV